MAKGTVKWFNTKKGYGFIVPEAGERDVFVHITQLERLGLRSLEEGQKISYELYADRNGRAAAGNLNVL
ncbi:MAG: cold-shock protein [Proteobacteria bacterium]|nr:cold-shock protein [Pseudomonadota bacterium]